MFVMKDGDPLGGFDGGSLEGTILDHIAEDGGQEESALEERGNIGKFLHDKLYSTISCILVRLLNIFFSYAEPKWGEKGQKSEVGYMLKMTRLTHLKTDNEKAY